eukprot:1659529-Rhodomonas_salina.2
MSFSYTVAIQFLGIPTGIRVPGYPVCCFGFEDTRGPRPRVPLCPARRHRTGAADDTGQRGLCSTVGIPMGLGKVLILVVRFLPGGFPSQILFFNFVPEVTSLVSQFLSLSVSAVSKACPEIMCYF